MAVLLNSDLLELFLALAAAGAITCLMVAVLARFIFIDRRHLATQPVKEEPMNGETI